MLHKNRSTQTALMKYGLIAPLFMLMIVVSSATLATKPIEQIEELVQEVSDKNAPLISDNSVIENNPQDPILDLSKAVVISPALVDEVRNYSKVDTGMVFTAVEEVAHFPGGMEAFSKYLEENLKYPQAAQKAKYSGKVFIQFTVNTNGSAEDFEVLKSADFGCDEEALRVMKSIPNWVAGKQSGKNVRSRFTVPINFQLTNDVKHSTFEFNDKNDKKIKKIIYSNPACKDCPPPMYIVDGMEVTDVINFDPQSIENMQVLKGESATLKYGEKGKNGVVLITLKKKENIPIQEKVSSEIFNEVEQQAEYPGGMEAFGKYLAKTLKYPAAAQRANKSGKVYVQFIINTDGTATDYNVVKSAGFGFDEEALRVISAVPKWTPGKQSGRVVRSRFTVPINFQLSE